MSLNFGHDELEPNHTHNVKPLVALPFYQLMATNFQFIYTAGINYGVWRMSAKEGSHIPRRDMITNGWVEPKNSQLELYAHTFDSDDNVTQLTMQYELVCFMLGGTIGHKLIDEFDLMSFKVTSGMIDSMNHFVFVNKRYFISDIQPNYKNMFKMSIIRTERTSQNPSGLNNESLLEMLTLRTQMMKQVNDVMLQTL